MHEYISDRHFLYSECIDCSKRSAHVCIRCHYCYSRHPKIEQLEKKGKIYSSKVRNTKTTIYEVQKEWTSKKVIHNCTIIEKINNCA
jgi:hypothetical protein